MNLINELMTRLRSELTRRQVARELAAKSERALDDMGIARDGIEQLARLAAQAPKPEPTDRPDHNLTAGDLTRRALARMFGAGMAYRAA